MIGIFKRYKLNKSFPEVLKDCIAFIKNEKFPNLKLGSSGLDGMSADPTVFLDATIIEKKDDIFKVKIKYSVVYKATLEEKGQFILTKTKKEIKETEP